MTQQKKNYVLPIIMMVLLFGMISFVTNLAGYDVEKDWL